MTRRAVSMPITFDPNDEDRLRDIPSQLIEKVYSDVTRYADEQKLKLGALYLANARDEKQPSRLKLQRVDTESTDGKHTLRDANVICLGGINHEHITIGTPAANYFRLKNILEAPDDYVFPPGGNTPDELKIMPADVADAKLLVFNPQFHRDSRVADAYTWNGDKHYCSFEMKNLGEQIWKAKFLDDNGELLPAAAVKPFSLYTFSFGARMSFMLENNLRQRLMDRILSDSRDFDIDLDLTYCVQQYFNKIKRVCIGSSVDLSNINPDWPYIETLHVLRQNDRGMAFEKGFCDNFIADPSTGNAPDRWFPNDAPYAKIDLKECFPASKGHKLLLLNHTLTSDTNPAGERGHGISEYAHDLRHLSATDRLEMLEMMTIGMREPGTPGASIHAPPTFKAGGMGGPAAAAN